MVSYKLALIKVDSGKVPKDKWRFYDEENKTITSIEFIDEKFDYSKLSLK